MHQDTKPTILIVDDEPDIREIYANRLNDSYNVRTSSGSDALGSIDDGIDVVLLDRRMPDVSGDELLSQIRERNIDCKVAMLTAVAPDFDITDLGFDDYLVKPASKEEINDVVEQLLVRSTYDESVQQYFALASKRAVLKAEKSEAELESNSTFDEMESGLAEARAQADEALSQITTEELNAMFQAIST